MSKDHNHQAPSGIYNYTDYNEKMNDLVFKYDQEFYPDDATLPDPQIEPVIPGKRVPLQKVGIAPVDLPIMVYRRDKTTQVLQSEASLYCSLDDPDAKGLNLSRLYLIMDEKIADHLSIDGMEDVLHEMADKQGANSAYCKLRFKYPWTQKALRSRKPDANGNPSDEKMEGHIAYNTVLEGRYTKGSGYQYFLTIEYVYSSTCPCSFELAHNATELRNAAANAHSQRSIMTTTIEFQKEDIVWIEDLVELHRQHIPTEVQVVVKRRDEQAFAELNGSNLLFSEDAVRLVYGALDEWYDDGKINNFTIVTSHEESLHPWNAIAMTSKFDDITPIKK